MWWRFAERTHEVMLASADQVRGSLVADRAGKVDGVVAAQRGRGMPAVSAEAERGVVAGHVDGCA